MKVAVFVVFAGRDYGGPRTYEQRIATEVAKRDGGGQYHIYALDPAARTTFAELPENARCHILRPRVRWLSVPFILPAGLLRDRVDLLHATVVPPPFCPVPIVFTMHDVTPFTFPENYPPLVGSRLRGLIKRGVTASQVVICVSKNAMETTMDLFKLPEDRFTVVYHGVSPRFHPVPRESARQCVAERLGLKVPYILFVGQMQKRKNLRRLLEAFHIFREQTRLDLKLALTGYRNYDVDSVAEVIERHRLREHVLELGQVPDEHMPALYSAAEALAFPSLWEGFGFPVLEAMACGTPVVTSRVSSLMEIAGDAALLIDPHSIEEIAAAMCRIATDSELSLQLRQKGIQRAATFTWERAAEQTIAAYKRAIGA